MSSSCPCANERTQAPGEGFALLGLLKVALFLYFRSLGLPDTAQGPSYVSGRTFSVVLLYYLVSLPLAPTPI